MKRLVPLVALLALAACDKSKAEPEAKQPQAPAKGEPQTAQPEAAQPKADEPSPNAAMASAEIAKAAPDFTLADLDGNEVTLSEHKGKTVVLEWFNPECPFVKYAHGEGPLKGMAKTYTDKGIVWLAINSGAPGKQGHGPEVNRTAATDFSMEHPILLDPSGDVGRAYGAEKTPHVMVIDAEGTLVYRGGVDNAPMGEVDGDGERTDLLVDALAAVEGGEAPAVAESRAYGCSVKYDG